MIGAHLLVLSALLTRSLAAVPIPVDGFCASYIIQGYDTCALIAQAHGITEADIEAFNTRTWAWLGCNQLYQGAFICLSPGEPPMPMALPNAICGPQIPGTARPSNWTDLGFMHPCPLTQCCATWGQCGTGIEYCDTKARKPPAGVTATVSAATEAEPRATELQATAVAIQTKSDNGVIVTQLPKSQTVAQPAEAHIEQSESQVLSTATSTTSESTTTTEEESLGRTDKPWEGSMEMDEWNEPWELTWYSEKDCKGDYYTLSGYNDEIPSAEEERCQNRKDGVNSAFTETGVMCRWWTAGGLKWDPCEAGTLEKPQSWILKNAYCTVFDAWNCDCFDHFSHSYHSVGCHNRDKFDPPKFVSFVCQRVKSD
ncbi:unnamed protein product [Penicillium salamii]|nr:unnamed protein product [Penicillium salamii]CAG7996812.1 unnamed protein product [Penicillium salamii]CAG8288772.1 unnamed protein product [Penicillium salamii]